MLEKNLGLLLLNKHVKRGAIVLLALSVNLSTGMHLRIYKELDTLLLDISANTSLKVRARFPREQRKILYNHLELSGAEWREPFLNQLTEISLGLTEAVDNLHLLTNSSTDWMSYLSMDYYAISSAGLSPCIDVILRGWSTDYTSVVDVCQLPRITGGQFQSSVISLINCAIAPSVTNNYEPIDKN